MAAIVTTNNFDFLSCLFFQTIGGLKQLMFLDASKNNLMCLPHEIEGCCSLADIHLTSNCLQSLPESIGKIGFNGYIGHEKRRIKVIPVVLPYSFLIKQF